MRFLHLRTRSLQVLLPFLISLGGCVSPPGTPPETFDTAVHAQAASAIADARVTNAVSGTLEVPIDLKAIAARTGGQPPASIHVFRTTGEVVREAHVSVYWKDERSLAFIVDNIQGNYPLVLAATIEPGVVVRGIVPAASQARPARSQVISPRTEIMVQEMIDLGLMPDVAPGGIGSVIAQGGLDPAGAAELNGKAALEMESAAASDAGRGIPQVKELATALQSLAQAQRAWTPDASPTAGECVGLHCAEQDVRNGWTALDQKLSEIAQSGGPSPELQQRLENARQLHFAAVQTDTPKPAQLLLPTNEASPQYRVQFLESVLRSLAARYYIGALYLEGQRLANESLNAPGPNGKPFTEAEIADALENGRGPYRESCSQVTFDPNSRNCEVVLNPLDQAREVAITRRTVDFEKQLKALEEADARDDVAAVAKLVTEMPSIFHFAVDDTRWQSPVGVWRLKLYQDEGKGLFGDRPLPILNDVETRIEVPGRAPGEAVKSGMIRGVISIWNHAYYDDDKQGLDNFSMQFNWDAQDARLSEGIIKGERRTQYKNGRVAYHALFDAQMVGGNRIKGIWKDEAEEMFGRFEMIRGTARFSITETYM